MRLTFEGRTIQAILDEMESTLEAYRQVSRKVQNPSREPAVADFFAEKSVDKPVDKPAKVRSPKQLENDAKLRERALAKKAAGLKVGDPMVPPIPPPPATAESLGLAPDEVARNRARTIEDLQAAYANGFQKEVFELLSRFGNGAKSFRELPPEAFVPIREAIDNGALT